MALMARTTAPRRPISSASRYMASQIASVWCATRPTTWPASRSRTAPVTSQPAALPQ